MRKDINFIKMYSKSAILTAATDIVGYRQSDNSNYSGLPAYLKTSNSGFYVNDIPGISLELIDDVKKERTFNSYVQEVHASETIQVINRFVDRQKKKLNSKELLSNVTIPQKFNDKSQTVTKNSRFVGYAITPRESKSINITITDLGVRGSSSGSITFYLYDPTQEAYLESKSITVTTSLAWTSLDWDIEFDKLDGGAGSTYLIGYFEDDLTGNFYEQDWNGQCAHAAMRVTKHYAGISPVMFSNSVLDGTNCPDMEYLEGALSCKTPGFGIRLNVKCDITDVLVDNITMFGEAIQYAIALRYLKDGLGNILLNPTISSAQNRVTFENNIADFSGMLYGGYVEDVGYRRGMIDNLTLDFSELDIVCLKPQADRISQVKF